VELAGEAEWHLIVLVVDGSPGVDAHVEGLVYGEEERSGVRDLGGRDLFIVHLQNTGAALPEAGSIVSEVEDDGVFAWRERVLAFPAEAFEVDKVIDEHGLALKQVQAKATEAATERDNHPSAAVLRARTANGGARTARNVNLGGDRIGPVQDAGRIALGQAGHLARINEGVAACSRARPRCDNALKHGVVQREDVVLGRL